MITITIQLFNIEELNKQAQRNAYNKWLETATCDDIWSYVHETLGFFYIETDIMGYPNDILRPRISHNDRVSHLRGLRLRTWLINNYRFLWKGKYYGTIGKYIPHRRLTRHVRRDGLVKWSSYRSAIQMDNDCVLTGTCYDMSLLHPIYDFIDNPNDKISFEELIEKCFNSLREDVENEIEHRQSFEYFLEECIENEWTFEASGNMRLIKDIEL